MMGVPRKIRAHREAVQSPARPANPPWLAHFLRGVVIGSTLIIGSPSLAEEPERGQDGRIDPLATARKVEKEGNYNRAAELYLERDAPEEAERVARDRFEKNEIVRAGNIYLLIREYYTNQDQTQDVGRIDAELLKIAGRLAATGENYSAIQIYFAIGRLGDVERIADGLARIADAASEARDIYAALLEKYTDDSDKDRIRGKITALDKPAETAPAPGPDAAEAEDPRGATPGPIPAAEGALLPVQDGEAARAAYRRDGRWRLEVAWFNEILAGQMLALQTGQRVGTRIARGELAWTPRRLRGVVGVLGVHTLGMESQFALDADSRKESHLDETRLRLGIGFNRRFREGHDFYAVVRGHIPLSKSWTGIQITGMEELELPGEPREDFELGGTVAFGTPNARLYLDSSTNLYLPTTIAAQVAASKPWVRGARARPSLDVVVRGQRLYLQDPDGQTEFSDRLHTQGRLMGSIPFWKFVALNAGGELDLLPGRERQWALPLGLAAVTNVFQAGFTGDVYRSEGNRWIMLWLEVRLPEGRHAFGQLYGRVREQLPIGINDRDEGEGNGNATLVEGVAGFR